MHLIINGDNRDIEVPEGRPFHVADMLMALNVPALKVAVELNRTIVAKSSYDQQVLNDGDQIEIVNFVGGG